MFRKSIIFFILSLFVILRVQAADLYAILIADTDATNIGKNTEITLHKFQQTIKTICSHTQLLLKESLFKGEDLKVIDIFSVIENLPIQPDDVVIFFFNGHGYNTKTKNDIWPNMYFTKEHVGLDMTKIANVILNKRARLNLVITDACNNIIPDYIPTFKPDYFLMTIGWSSEAGYKKLFLESSGFIQIASAKKGAFSYTNNLQGAFYTTAFIKNLENEVFSGTQADWAHLLEETSETLKIFKQYPQHQLVIY